MSWNHAGSFFRRAPDIRPGSGTEGENLNVESPIDLDSIRPRERLQNLGSNLWWSWEQRLDSVLRRIDAKLWDHLRHNPTAFLCDVTSDKLEGALPAVIADVIAIEDSLAAYLSEPRTWAAGHCRGIASSAIAYFSPEFCIHESRG